MKPQAKGLVWGRCRVAHEPVKHRCIVVVYWDGACFQQRWAAHRVAGRGGQHNGPRGAQAGKDGEEAQLPGHSSTHCSWCTIVGQCSVFVGEFQCKLCAWLSEQPSGSDLHLVVLGWLFSVHTIGCGRRKVSRVTLRRCTLWSLLLMCMRKAGRSLLH